MAILVTFSYIGTFKMSELNFSLLKIVLKYVCIVFICESVYLVEVLSFSY